MSEFFISADEKEIKKEKEKARQMRKKQWWRQKVSLGECYYCGGAFEPSELTMDHIVPLARGGKSTKGNIAACCKECNSKKKYMLPTEWDEYLTGIKENKEGDE